MTRRRPVRGLAPYGSAFTRVGASGHPGPVQDTDQLAELSLREIPVLVLESVVWLPAAEQKALRISEAKDTALRTIVPIDVECSELRKELEPAVREAVMYPVGQRPPVLGMGITVREPRYHYAGRGPATALGVQMVPYVSGVVLLVRSAVMALLIPYSVHRGGSIRRADRDPAKRRIQWLKEFLAKPSPDFDGKVRVLWDVRNPIEIRDLAVQKVAHEE